MSSDITESSLYKEAIDRPASSLAEPVRVKNTIDDISVLLDKSVERNSDLDNIHSLGKMFKQSISRNAKSSDVLINFFNCYYELLFKELDYNNYDKEKMEIVKKGIKNIQNTLEIIKATGGDCDKEKILTLMRSYSL